MQDNLQDGRAGKGGSEVKRTHEYEVTWTRERPLARLRRLSPCRPLGS